MPRPTHSRSRTDRRPRHAHGGSACSRRWPTPRNRLRRRARQRAASTPPTRSDSGRRSARFRSFARAAMNARRTGRERQAWRAQRVRSLARRAAADPAPSRSTKKKGRGVAPSSISRSYQFARAHIPSLDRSGAGRLAIAARVEALLTLFTEPIGEPGARYHEQRCEKESEERIEPHQRDVEQAKADADPERAERTVRFQSVCSRRMSRERPKYTGASTGVPGSVQLGETARGILCP